MDNQPLQKRYGLLTAICMVVGIVIGSGVFFKAQDILVHTNGNMPLGILAWFLGGMAMVLAILAFSVLARRYARINGIIDYAEETVGPRYGYLVGWFVTTIYYPSMTSVLAWVSARYTVALFGENDPASGITMVVAGFYLCLSCFINVLAPRISGKFQVSTTFIKLVPLVLMAIVGTAVGLWNGNTLEAFTSSASAGADGGTLFAATVATAFAYEGWIIATSINAELRDAKRNLPIALVGGSLIIIVIYIIYYIGLAGVSSVDELIAEGAQVAFRNLFGNVAGTLLNVFVVISCLGTLNGLMLACTRSMYSLAVRGHGPRPETMSSLDKESGMPVNSGIVGLLICAVWLFYFYGANLMPTPLFGLFSFDSSELPVITVYAFYIPIFIAFMCKHGREDKIRNLLFPILAILASAFMVFAALYAHGISKYEAAAARGEFSFPVLFYLIMFAVIMGIGMLFYHKKSNKETGKEERS
jgi:APA family basic amino acid/polyamine antiporter